jgi:membrane-bound lytic murein transglycosylase B
MPYRLFIFLVLFLFPFSFCFANTEFVERPDVREFIKKMVHEHGFNKVQLENLFSKIKLRPQVIRHIKKPLEKNPWHTYQMLFVNEWRIEHGVKFWQKYADALKRAEKVYGVPPAIIVATIGIETKYGQKTGEYRVLDSLANLAFNTSRSPFFKKELAEFLLLTREQHLEPLKVMGSYAGAIGQPQFMPSSYRAYAVNFSGSGKIDLMNDEVDVIGSIANYYKKNGWKKNLPVAVPAKILGNRYDYLQRKNKISHAMSSHELAKYGIVPKYEQHNNIGKVKVIQLQNHYNNEYWLGFHNFEVIRRYNPNDLYAMAVYQLSSYIVAVKERLNHG